jgi:hypothetical protein
MTDQTAIVAVSKDWFESGGGILMSTRANSSSGEIHIVIADLKDTSGPVGVWLKNIKREGLTRTVLN